MPLASSPLVIAALDAGSNAIRAVVARAGSATEIRELASARWTVRLGHGVFNKRHLDPRTASRAVDAFVQFRSLLDRYEVAEYRAVATSAVREASNREAFVARVRRQAGIDLTVVESFEEARLVREAVFAAAGGRFIPRVIADLGGGSLEISLLRGRKVTRSMAMPLGAVRLMEMFDLAGSFTPDGFARVRRRVTSVLHAQGRVECQTGRASVVACGGNAEALSRLAPGPQVEGFGTINLARLDRMLWDILRRDVEERMDAFGVRRDRAEVMGVAAVVFTALGEWLGAKQMLVPAIGVREGILHDLAAAHFGPATAHDERAEALRQQARRFAARMHSDGTHCEQVRKLAVQLFNQLAPVHGLAPDQRVPLELAALLHDTGRTVHTRAHHKHGEYLVRHADIPGLGRHQQQVVACLVRYHGKSTPEPHHRLYRSLAPAERLRVRQLSALLRIAVALDADNTQSVRRVEVKIFSDTVWLRPSAVGPTRLDSRELRRKARYFEQEFGVHVRFGRLSRARGTGGRPESSQAMRPSAVQRRSAA